MPRSSRSKATVRQLTGCAQVLRWRQDSLTGSHRPRCSAPLARRPEGLRQPRSTERSRLAWLPSTTNEKGQSVERGLQVLDAAHACCALFWQSAPSLGRNQVAAFGLPGRRYVQFQGTAFHRHNLAEVIRKAVLPCCHVCQLIPQVRICGTESHRRSTQEKGEPKAASSHKSLRKLADPKNKGPRQPALSPTEFVGHPTAPKTWRLESRTRRLRHLRRKSRR